MTIRKGEDWGRPGSLPSGSPIVDSDAALSEILRQARDANQPPPVVGVVGGDLWRTMGRPGGGPARLTGDDARRYPCDLGVALVDGRVELFVAHLIVRRRWWRGRTVAFMNAEFVGEWMVAPRSHPNDGQLDMVDATLTAGQRWHAWRRLPTGRHVPHPDIRARRTKAEQLDLEPGARVITDGRDLGAARRLSVRIEPDAFEIVV